MQQGIINLFIPSEGELLDMVSSWMYVLTVLFIVRLNISTFTRTLYLSVFRNEGSLFYVHCLTLSPEQFFSVPPPPLGQFR